MARFNIYTGNHVPSARISVQDHSQWIKGGLEALGHEVAVSDTDISRSAMNILFEWFQPPFAESLRSSGVEYILVCSERADGGGFNGRRDAAWTTRWREFTRAAHGARGIWTLFEGNERKVQHFAPAAYLEFGYEPTMRPAANEVKPDIDIMFFGSVDERRGKLLAEMCRRGLKVLYTASVLDNDALARHLLRADLIIDPRGPNRIPIPSVARVGRALHLPRAVAIERTPENQGLGRYGIISPVEGMVEFANFCEGLLADRKALHDGAAETLARIEVEIPNVRCVERALDLTIGRTTNWARPASRPNIPVVRFMVDLTAHAEAANFFRKVTLPSLLSAGNLANIANRARVTFDVFVPASMIASMDGNASEDLPSFCDIRTRAVQIEDYRGPVEAAHGLDDDISRPALRFLKEHAGSDAWLIDASGFRVFGDGTLSAMLDEILAWEARRNLGRIFVPTLAARPRAFAGWCDYQKWGDYNAAQQAPSVPNDPYKLIALAGRQEAGVSAGYYVRPVGADAALLMPLFPKALAVNGRAVVRGHLRAAWHPCPADRFGDAFLSDAKQGLLIEAKPEMDSPRLISPAAILALLAATSTSTIAAEREDAMRRHLSSAHSPLLVVSGGVDVEAMAAAEDRMEGVRQSLLSGLGLGNGAAMGSALSSPGGRHLQAEMVQAAAAGG